MSDDEDLECPLCMEEIDITDKYFKPCPCGYQVCRFCWNHIKENLNGLCPACRRPYSDENIEFKAVSTEELNRIKNAKKRKEKEKKEQDLAARKQLANVRVVQKNLVYVLGLPLKLANEDLLKSPDYFGQYGKITKIVVNKRPPQQAGQPANTGVYITYARKEDAARAIDNVDGSMCDNKVIRATFGTTKYCSYYLKNQPCQNVGCQFLHETGEEADTFGKDELIHRDRDRQQRTVLFPFGRQDKEENVLPAAASWAKSLNNTRQFPMLSQSLSQTESLYDSDEHAAPMNDQNYPPLDLHDQKHTDAHSIATSENKSVSNKYNKSITSASLPNEPVQYRDNNSEGLELTPFEAGYTLAVKYNGLFNPFSEEIIELGKKKPELENDRKSRFERLFDSRYQVVPGEEQQNPNESYQAFERKPSSSTQNQFADYKSPEHRNLDPIQQQTPQIVPQGYSIPSQSWNPYQKEGESADAQYLRDALLRQGQFK